MKQFLVCAFLGLYVGMPSAKAQQMESTEQILKEVTFDTNTGDNTFVVRNISGSIMVEGYDGNTIAITVDKTIRADKAADLELGKKEIGLMVEKVGDKYIAYPEAPNLEFRDGHLSTVNCRDYQHTPYDYTLTFKIRIPRGINLEAGTVNDGEVVIANTSGSFLKADNVNGGIELRNVSGQTEVHCINGAVMISYADNPSGPSTYYSLNGDINISYQRDLSAEIGFKSMNGDLFTDFEIADQFAKASKNESSDGAKPKYRYESKPVVQIGNGKFYHDFETLNGNVFIKKI